jgi:Transposase DDE domain
MSHAKALYQWDQRVATYFAELPPARRAWLALVSYGLVLARSALLNAVVLRLAVALGATFNAVRQRVRKLYQPRCGAGGHDLSFDPAACFGPLLRWASAGFSDRRLALAIDPTNLGDRFTVLTVSVVFRGCAVPVAWQVQRGEEKGSWNDHWKRLLGLLRQALGDGWQVLVLSDRGLESKGLFEAICALGWHPLMRVKKAGHFRPEGWHKGWPLRHFAARRGARWRGRGVAWPTGSRLACTLLACWEGEHEEPWLVLTDLGPAEATAWWYAWRSWIEHGFRDLKSDGWGLSRTRMAEPERVARWWAAAALATLWALEAGAQALRLEVPATRTHASAAQAAVTSLFALGLAVLAEQLGRRAVRRLRRLPQPRWPSDASRNDPLCEQQWITQHQAVPL